MHWTLLFFYPSVPSPAFLPVQVLSSSSCTVNGTVAGDFYSLCCWIRLCFPQSLAGSIASFRLANGVVWLRHGLFSLGCSVVCSPLRAVCCTTMLPGNAADYTLALNPATVLLGGLSQDRRYHTHSEKNPGLILTLLPTSCPTPIFPFFLKSLSGL